eukprot:gene986-biopygen21227
MPRRALCARARNCSPKETHFGAECATGALVDAKQMLPRTGQVDSGIHVLGPWDGTSGYATSSPSRLITHSDFLRAAMVGCGRASAGLTRIDRVPCDGRSGFGWCQTPPTQSCHRRCVILSVVLEEAWRRLRHRREGDTGGHLAGVQKEGGGSPPPPPRTGKALGFRSGSCSRNSGFVAGNMEVLIRDCWLREGASREAEVAEPFEHARCVRRGGEVHVASRRRRRARGAQLPRRVADRDAAERGRGHRRVALRTDRIEIKFFLKNPNPWGDLLHPSSE